MVVASPPAAAVITANDSFSSCVRGTPVTNCSSWVNGNVTGYFEDQVVPQRVVAQVSGAGTHTFAVEYQDVAGSVHKIDYLASWDYTQSSGACTGLSGAALTVCNAGNPAVGSMASDGSNRGSVVAGYTNSVQQRELPQSDRQWKIFGATQVTGSTVTHPNALTGLATVTFTTAGAGPVVIMFGAHVALSGPASNPRAWAQGGSFDNGTVQLALSEGGNKTNNLKFGANTPPPPAAFTITKTASSPTAPAGSPITYTVTVTNNGGSAGTATFVDDYADTLSNVTPPTGCSPAGTGQMSCTTTNLAAGASATFTYTPTLPATFSGGAGSDGCAAGLFPVRNTATFAAGTLISTGGTNTATALVCVTAAAEFSITKTPSTLTPDTGQTVTYEVVVENTGDAPGTTSFVEDFDDRLSPVVPASCTLIDDAANTYDCTTGQLAVGATQTFSFSAAMPGSFSSGTTCAGGYTVTNSVTLAGGTPVNANVCVQAAPAFAVTKTVDEDEVGPGDSVEYTVTVTNTGTAPGSTTATDDFDDRLGSSISAPTGCTKANGALTCVTDPLAPDQSVSFTYTATMPTTFATGDEVGGPDCAPDEYVVRNDVALSVGSDTAEATVCVAAVGGLVVTKSAFPTTAGPGDEVTYTIEITNNGSAPAGTSFTDDYDEQGGAVTLSDFTFTPDAGTCSDSGLSLVCSTTAPIEPGETLTLTYVATIGAQLNEEPVAGTCADGRFPLYNEVLLANGEDADTTVCLDIAADFTVTKTVAAEDQDAEPGDVVDYTITVENIGSAPGSTSFTDDYSELLTLVTDPVRDPTGGACVDDGDTIACTTAVLDAGASQTFTYSGTLPDTFTGDDGGGDCGPGTFLVANSVTLDDGSSSDSQDICVTAAPALSITKEAAPASVGAGGSVEYTITVTNDGDASGSTTFTDTYAVGVVLGEVTIGGSGGSCSDENGVLSCTTGTINAGDAQTFTYTAQMPATFTGDPGGGACGDDSYSVTNTVLMGLTMQTVEVCVAAAPEFEVTKTSDVVGVATPGQEVTYTITVLNTGTASGSTTVTDDFDPLANPGEVEGCENDGVQLTCATGVLAPLTGTVVLSYTVTLPTTFSGTPGGAGCADDEFRIANTASVPGDEPVTAVVCVDADAQFSIEKTATHDEPLLPGGTVDYQVRVTNIGAAPGSTSFTDVYDEGLTLTPPAGCDAGANSFTCTTSVLGLEESQDFTYTATVPATYGSPADTAGCEPGEFGFANTATIDGGGAGSNEIVCVTASPDVSIDKTVDGLAAVGETLTYTITVRNDGAAAAPPVTFTDTYAAALLEVTTPEAELPDVCEAGSGSFTCTTGVIAAGTAKTFTYTGVVPAVFNGDSDGCEPGSFPVSNSVTSTDVEGDAVDLCVPAAPEFEVDKSFSFVPDQQGDPVRPGDTVTYTIRVTNTGTAAGAYSFIDDYDDRLEPSVPAGCTDEGGFFACSTGIIDADPGADQFQEFTYTAVMPATFTTGEGEGDCAAGEYLVVNTVKVGDDDVAHQDVCVTANAAFIVDKSVEAEEIRPGAPVRYTVTVTNNGDATGSTTFVDDYDDSLDASIDAPAGCEKADGTLVCETAALDPDESQTFTYDAVLPTTYSGETGVEPCGEGEYAIANVVTIGDQVEASETVCVAAGARFTVAKFADVADNETAVPSQDVAYTITVANVGEVTGSTTFVDTFDERLSPTVPDDCELVGSTLECTAADLAPGQSRDFVYTAVMPASYTGPSGTGGCSEGSYPVVNRVVLANNLAATETVCVAAAPEVALVKTASLDTSSTGEQIITYTLTYSNTGAAEARDVVVSDPVPAGTVAVECTEDCEFTGTTVFWQVGSVAPVEGTGEVALRVRVTTNETCLITNTASIKVGSGPDVASNTVTTAVSPQPDPSGAKSNGSSVGISLRTNGLLNLVGPLVGGVFTNNNTLALSRASSSQSGLGGPAIDSESLLTAKIPSNGSLVSAGVLTTTSASSVTAAPAEARQTTVSEVVGLCLVKVAGICTVQSDTVRAVATTMANGSYASVSTAGSAIENLRVVNTAVPVNLNQTTTIPLNAGVFGKGSYVAINERTGTSGLSGNKYVADQSVAMIHVKITGALGVQAVEIFVGQATAHSEFPKTLVCAGARTQAVSGHAYTTRLYTGPLLADLLQGYVQISPLGGAETEHIAEVVVPSTGVIVNAKVADSTSAGGLTPTSSVARSFAEVAGDGTKPACVLSYVTNCVAKATVIRSEANALANATGSTSTSAGTQFLGLSVFGIPIAGTPAPNTTLVLPGIGFIVLNEQFCDNGGPASGTCAGNPHSGITVRAVRVVVTVANNILGLNPGVELVVAEAHADAMFS